MTGERGGGAAGGRPLIVVALALEAAHLPARGLDADVLLTGPGKVSAALAVAAAVAGPIEVRIYEDEGHVLGGVISEAMRAAVDWLADRFADRPMTDTGVEIVAAYQ